MYLEAGGSLLTYVASQPPGEKRKVQSKYSQEGTGFNSDQDSEGCGCMICVCLLPPSVLTRSLHLYGALPKALPKLHAPSFLAG